MLLYILYKTIHKLQCTGESEERGLPGFQFDEVVKQLKLETCLKELVSK